MANTLQFQPYAPGTTATAGGARLGSIDPRLSRTNYFDGQLLKATDLTRDQIYLDERLLELGQAFGAGIAEGLDLDIADGRYVRVQPGLAIAPSGRVLKLSGRVLEADLQNSALIASLNNGAYRQFPRGLYAVVLQHAEVASGVAEAYPTDLESRRQWKVSEYAEGVELVLVPLPIGLPRGDALTLRATLAREILHASGSLMLPSDDAIALGLVAIEQAVVAWYDKGLVRRRLRNPLAPAAQGEDLALHYVELLHDVLDARSHAGLGDGFPAAQYFRMLPAHGPLPKAAIDPVNGTQIFFPKAYEVSIAPVRRSDLPRLLADSALLAPIDLERDADIDVMVLVPMDDASFALRARQLEADPVAGTLGKTGILAHLDVFALRLYAPPALGTEDRRTWEQIWAAVAPSDVRYVRRPPRTAETNVSAVVLARGFAIPEEITLPQRDLLDSEHQLDQALTDIQALQVELSQQRPHIQDLEAQLATASGDLTTARNQVDSLNATNTSLTDANARLTGDLANLKTTNDTLTGDLQSATSRADEADARATALQGTVAELNTTITQLQARIDENPDQRVAQLTTDLAAAQAAADTARQQLADTTSQLNAQRTAAEAATNQATAAQARADDLQNQLNSANGRVASTESDLAGARDALNASNARLSATSAALDAANNRIGGLQNDVTTAQNALTVARGDADQLRAQVAGLNVELSNQAQIQAGLRNQIAADQATQAQLTAQINQQASQINALNNQIQLLQRQLADLRANPNASGVTLADVARVRGAQMDLGLKLDDQLRGRPSEVLNAAYDLFLLIGVEYDEVLWPSLQDLARQPDRLPKLRDELVQLLTVQRMTVPKAMVQAGQNAGLSPNLINQWANQR